MTTNEEIKLTDIKIEKITDAHVSHGRGMDNYRMPAKWRATYKGAVVAIIAGKAQRQFALASWSVYSTNGAVEVRCMLKSRMQAVVWVQNNIEKLIEAAAKKS